MLSACATATHRRAQHPSSRAWRHAATCCGRKISTIAERRATRANVEDASDQYLLSNNTCALSHCQFPRRKRFRHPANRLHYYHSPPNERHPFPCNTCPGATNGCAVIANPQQQLSPARDLRDPARSLHPFVSDSTVVLDTNHCNAFVTAAYPWGSTSRYTKKGHHTADSRPEQLAFKDGIRSTLALAFDPSVPLVLIAAVDRDLETSSSHSRR
jgi:hypothetical protein